jgi:hypothetical protein
VTFSAWGLAAVPLGEHIRRGGDHPLAVGGRHPGGFASPTAVGRSPVVASTSEVPADPLRAVAGPQMISRPAVLPHVLHGTFLGLTVRLKDNRPMHHQTDAFATWLAARARDAGHDTDSRLADEAIAVIATLAGMNGLSGADAKHIAEVLNVSPAEVTAAHTATQRSEHDSDPRQDGPRRN